MVNLNSRCTAENKGRKSLSPTIQTHCNSGAKHLQKHSRDFSTIQAFYYCDKLHKLYNTLQQLLENQKN